MNEFKWGIIGPGRIAYKFAEALQAIKGAAIYAIASRSTQDPEGLRKAFSAEKCYQSYEALVEDPDVNAIYIATPHRFHYENALLCMQVGKPVLCEKSFTVNARQAEELFSLSQEKQIFLMEALWTRFLPIYESVRDWLDAEEIGDVRHIHSTLGFIARRDHEDRLLNINLAGGTVLDLGVYANGLSQWVFQDNPKHIQAFGYIGETGVDESITVSYEYDRGASAQFHCTFETQPQNRLVIIGTEGYITVHTNFVDAVKATLSNGKKEKTIRKPHRVNGFEYQIEASMDAIRHGKLDCPQMTQADTLANMQTLDAVRRQIGLHYPFE